MFIGFLNKLYILLTVGRCRTTVLIYQIIIITFIYIATFLKLSITFYRWHACPILTNYRSTIHDISSHSWCFSLTLFYVSEMKAFTYLISNTVEASLLNFEHSVDDSSLKLVRHVINEKVVEAYENLQIIKSCLNNLLNELVYIKCNHSPSTRKKGRLVKQK